VRVGGLRERRGFVAGERDDRGALAFKCGVRSTSSSVSPEFDSISTTSSGVIMPRSPCEASAGCTKNAGVPVDANVAASFRAM
jgi:hypothetical protein